MVSWCFSSFLHDFSPFPNFPSAGTHPFGDNSCPKYKSLKTLRLYSGVCRSFIQSTPNRGSQCRVLNERSLSGESASPLCSVCCRRTCRRTLTMSPNLLTTRAASRASRTLTVCESVTRTETTDSHPGLSPGLIVSCYCVTT